MCLLDLELVATQVREDSVAVAAQAQQHLQRVIARRDRALEDRDLFLPGERPGIVLLVVLDRAVEHEQRARETESTAHVVLKADRGTCADDAARKDRVAQQAEAGVAAPDLLFQLVDSGFEIAQAYRVGGAIHLALGRLVAGCLGAERSGRRLRRRRGSSGSRLRRRRGSGGRRRSGGLWRGRRSAFRRGFRGLRRIITRRSVAIHCEQRRDQGTKRHGTPRELHPSTSRLHYVPYGDSLRWK
jgi:hypothetical protein